MTEPVMTYDAKRTKNAQAIGPVLAAGSWATNSDLIADVARLGYIKAGDRVLDPTYNSGKWWRSDNLPAIHLLRHDIQPKYAPDGVMDFTALAYPDAAFDVAAFDPNYVAIGGRSTSKNASMNESYGMSMTPSTPAENQQQINQGVAEMLRVVKGRGIVLVKVMDYISSGKLWLGVHHTITHGLALGARVEDMFIHVGAPGPQPSRNPDGSERVQKHARNNHSTLIVFRKVKK